MMRDRGSTLFNQEEMQSMVAKFHNFIGKDMILQDLRDPLGGNLKTQQDQKVLVEKFKLYLESLVDVDSAILTFAQKSISQYKNKSRQLKQSSAAMFRRMIHFISYHISETVLAQQKNSGSKTQKYRTSIAKSLIDEGWTQEALQFIERAKCEVGDNLAFFFDYEMQVLNYDREITADERQRRFVELIRKVGQSRVDPE